MRVLFWAEAFFPDLGGVEVFGLHLMRALEKRGHHFSVITSLTSTAQSAEEEFSRNISIYRFPFRAALANQNLRQIRELQRQVADLKQRLRPDLIHLNSTLPSTFFHLQTAKACPIPVLLTLHMPGTAAFAGADGLLAKVLQSVDLVTAVSTSVYSEACQANPDLGDRLRLVYNCIPAPHLAPPSPPRRRVLCLGRLTHQKGFDVAIQAFSAVLKRCPEARMQVVGGGEERAALENQATRLGIEGSVEFTGWVQPERVAEVMANSTMILMPSRYEPFGLVALEAAHMARPVIGSRVDGLQEVVEDGVTGLLIEKDKPHLLADAIVTLLERPEICVQLGRAGRKRARRLFDFEAFVESYEKLYQETASRGPRGSRR
jgi:glycosyltransferase involved in cell wall biosynthesis